MSKTRKLKPTERPIFDTIRKPIAPQSRRFGLEKPEDKAHPAARKVKHKKDVSSDE